ncbi:MAG: hypothetical protein PVI86_02765 [Phycisphaerae bacterium]|jgi:hypothetical protein
MKLILTVVVYALSLSGGAVFGQRGSCLLDLQVSGGGELTARGISGLVDPELNVEVGPAGSYVVLESSCIRAEFEPYVDGHDQFGMRHLYLKNAGNEDQICPECNNVSYFGGGAFRGVLVSATIIRDRLDRKTVRFVWLNSAGNVNKKVVEEVSIYPDACFLKTDYINVTESHNIVDLGRPGGTAAGTHVAQGGDAWIRGYITHDSSEAAGSYYNRYPPDGVNDPLNAGSLNHNGHFIVGVYNAANGRGFGRALPVTDVSIVKLLLSTGHRRGLEFFPHPFLQPHDPFTGYLYTVEGGEAQMLSLGRDLVDNGPGSAGIACGDVVELEAKAYTGWAFDHWAGSLTGNTNPTTLTVTGLDAVTAVFRVADATHFESFEAYAAGADPSDWLDTAADYGVTEEDHFEIIDLGGDRAFGTFSTTSNVHSHYVGPGAANWASYEYSGRMRQSDVSGSMGVTFFSDFPVSNRYYRLRRGGFPGGESFHVSPNGMTIAGSLKDTSVTPLADTWYRFRIRAQNTGLRTDIRAKVWPDGGTEPLDWQVECYDNSGNRAVSGTVGLWSAGPGSKQWDELTVRTFDRVFVERFSGYAIGADPADWFDTAAGSVDVPEDNFAVSDVAGNRTFGTVSAATNIHTHYLRPGAECWGNHELSGRMRITDAAGGIGLTFLSEYPATSRYYRLRRADFVGGTAFHIAPVGTTIAGGVTSTGVVPAVDTWYEFRIEVKETGARTEIRAKVWADGSTQPLAWQIDCYDDSANRLTSGTIGLWSMGPGAKHWDDLTVGILSVVPPDSPPTCDDGSVCTIDACSGASCVFTDTTPAGFCCDPLTGALTALDDGDPCTSGVCNGDGSVTQIAGGQVVVSVQIEGVSSPVTRDVTAVITTCGGSVDTRVVPVALDGSGAGTLVLDGVDATADWLYVTEGHTLGTLVPLDIVACSDAVDMSGADRLRAGDFHTDLIPKDNLVDITDFSILAADFNSLIDATDARGADCTADGVQGTADFTVFQVNYFTVGDPTDNCGQAASSSRGQRVGNLTQNATAPKHRIALAQDKVGGSVSADLDRDGVIGEADIREFARRHGLRLTPEFETKLAPTTRTRSSRATR